MTFSKFARKIKRELVAGLSKIYVPHVTTTYLGLKIKVPLIHGMRNGGYIVPAEIWMSDCLRSFVATKKGCVLDIGVNVGLYLVKLKTISDTVDYYGVDPNPACTFYTQELIRLNHFENAKVFTFALGESAEIANFYASQRNDSMGSLMEEHQAQNKMDYSFDTAVLGGDSFVDMLPLDEGICVIKIDVERAELYVLRGLEETIKKFTPFIAVEILDATTQEQKDRISEIDKLFRNLDYSILGINRDTNKLDSIKEIRAVERDYAEDFIFVPNDCLERFLTSIALNESGIELGVIER